MGFTFNGLSGAAVVLSGGMSIPQVSTSQTFKNFYGTGTGANQDLYTVPAGKSFALYGMAVRGSAYGQLFQTDGTTYVLELNGNGALGNSAISSVCPIFIYAAGEIVKFKGSLNVGSNVWGLEY